MLDYRDVLFSLNPFSTESFSAIHQASSYILQHVGVRIDAPWMVEELRERGCLFKEGRVFFAEELMGSLLEERREPEPLVLKNPFTKKRAVIGASGFSSHPFGSVMDLFDVRLGKVRPATTSDLVDSLHLINHLDQIDLPIPALYPKDVPPAMSQIKMTEALIRYSAKPFCGPGISSLEEAETVVELYLMAQGDQREYVGTLGLSPESPLFYPAAIVEIMRTILLAEIPLVLLVAPIAGITSPMTMAGSLAQMQANLLAGAIMAKIIEPTTPVIFGPRISFPNMKKGYSIWGLPEIGMMGAFSAQLATYYGYHSDVYGLSCNSCALDPQSGYEKAMNGLLPVLAGASMLSGAGGLGSSAVGSLEQLVIDNEILCYMRKILKGFHISEKTIAMDVLQQVVGGDSFLAQPHTVEYLRQGEILAPTFGFDGLFKDWEKDGHGLIHRAHDEVDRVLAQEAEEFLPQELDREVTKLLEKAKREA